MERERRIGGRTSWSKLFLKSDETDDILNKMKQQMALVTYSSDSCKLLKNGEASELMISLGRIVI